VEEVRRLLLSLAAVFQEWFAWGAGNAGAFDRPGRGCSRGAFDSFVWVGRGCLLKKKQRAGLAHCQRRFFLSETINAKYFSGGFWHWGPLLVLTKPGDGRLAPDQLLVFYSLPKTTRGWL
jgi:hypothetical protein